MQRRKVSIDGRKYEVDVLQRSRSGPNVVSIIQPCHNGRALTEVSIECIRKFTTRPYGLWVVDNASTDDTVAYLLDQPDINLILNRTAPWQSRWFWQKAIPWWQQTGGGSYANAIALELAAHFVQTRYMFVMHNDALPCKSGWLGYLLSKMTDHVRGVGVRHDKIRVHAMHQSGFLFDFSRFHPLQMSFLPNMPDWDVGDMITVRLQEAGYQCFFCANTFNDSNLSARPNIANSWSRDVHCDKAIDDDDEVFYLHLGRGTLQVAGLGDIVRKTTAEEWLAMVRLHLLTQTS